MQNLVVLTQYRVHACNIVQLATQSQVAMYTLAKTFNSVKLHNLIYFAVELIVGWRAPGPRNMQDS